MQDSLSVGLDIDEREQSERKPRAATPARDHFTHEQPSPML
jgi:hypothetical protein